MPKILKFSEYDKSMDQAFEIIENICNPKINESNVDDSLIKSICHKLSRDLKFNTGLIFSFGTGITVMYPIVDGLIKNGSLKFESTPENIVLICITSLAITYLEEVKNKPGDERIECEECKGKNKKCKSCDGTGWIKSVVTKRDAQTMLEELRMRGIGNGIVKKFVSSFKAIGEFFNILFRGTPYVVTGLIDMFSYTTFLLPAMNAIHALVGKYDLTLDTIVSNLLSVGVGVGTIVMKQGITWLVNKLRKSLNIKSIGRDLETPVAVRPYDIIDNETEIEDSKLIKEQ